MRLFIILLLSSAMSLMAQTKPKVSFVEVYLYTADYAKGHKTVYLANAKGGYYEVGLSTANIYGPFRTILSEGGEVFLCERKAAPPELKTKDGFIYPPIAEIKIPNNMKQPLLVLVPSEGKMRYKALLVERSVTEFPMGSYKMINFSSRDVRGMIGKTLAKVPARGVTAFNPLNENKENRLKVQFQYKEGAGWRTFGSTKWSNRADRRALLCAYLAPDTGLMKIRGIPVKEPVKIPPQ